MKFGAGFLFTLALALAFSGAAPTLASAAQSETACEGEEAVVLAARTPEVDLFDAPSGGARVLTLTKDAFPKCLAILAQTPARMLKVAIEEIEYWVPPHMVEFRATDTDPPVCRSLVAGGAESRTGATRGLGEGC